MKAMLRALKLLILGLLLQGGYFHGIHKLTYGVDILSIRIMGVLQRIAIAYIVAAICEIWLRSDDEIISGWSLLRRYRFQMVVGLILFVIYVTFLYSLYVPDWEYQIQGPGSTVNSFSVKCGVRGDTGPACNAVGMINRKIMGIEHLYRRPIYRRMKHCSINSPASGPLPLDAPSWCQAPFDPEGILRLNSTLKRLNEEADNIERKALNTTRKLNTGLKILNVVTIVTVSVNLFVILALLGPFLRLRRIFHMLIILCWVLTFLFWLYFGLYYFLNKL